MMSVISAHATLRTQGESNKVLPQISDTVATIFL